MLPTGPMGPRKRQTLPASIFRCYRTGPNCKITFCSCCISTHMEVKAIKFSNISIEQLILVFMLFKI